MPRLLARHVSRLRRAPCAVRPLYQCRSIFRARPAMPSHDGDLKPEPLFGGIVIPASVEKTLRALACHVQSVNSRAASLNTFCVFFVTPAYASQLLNGNDFLNVAIRAAYRALLTKPDVVIDVLCAVVHKLPVTRAVRNENGVLSRHELERLGLEPPVAGTGFEGMAYALLDPNASVSSKHLPPSDNGAIDFITAQHVSKGSLHLDTLRLPLANTVFQTGTTTTMFLSQWKTTGRMDGIDLISRTNVSHHGIRITPPPKSYSKLVTALSIPLIPLTVPRVVQGCMGNIIRQIVDSRGQSVQASSELESVVPRFFRSRGQPAQATVAWALVIPGHLKDTMTSRTEHLLANLPTEDVAASTKQKDIWELLWRSKPPMWNNLVSEALAEGARLHRVLSGGGGWGKKAGLLSLDPVPTNQATESSDDALLETDNDPEDFESTLTPVVQAGDSIQFFISPKSDLSQEASRSDNLKALESFPTDQACGPWGWEIGTIPSTVDSIPGESWQHRPLQGDDEITDFRGATVFRGGFGALTEGALTLTQHSMVWDEVTPRLVNTTMIDVPFSRLWAVNWREGKIPVRERPGESIRKAFQVSNRSSSVTPASSSRSSFLTLHQSLSRQKTLLSSPATNASCEISRQFSSTALCQASKLVNRTLDNWVSQLPRPLTVQQLCQALDLEKNQISTRLSVRAASNITRELDRRFFALRKRGEAIMIEMLKPQKLKRLELQRRIEQIRKKPGKSGIYLQPRVKRCVSDYVNIKNRLTALSEEVSGIVTALRSGKRRKHSSSVSKKRKGKAQPTVRKVTVDDISTRKITYHYASVHKITHDHPSVRRISEHTPIRKIALDHAPLSVTIEPHYQFHIIQITNLIVDARSIIHAIRNRMPVASAIRRVVAASGPSKALLQKWRDGYHETARAQLRRWSAKHVRFHNDITFIEYLVRRRRREQASSLGNGNSAVPLNRYYAKTTSAAAAPKKAGKPRVRNNTLGIRRIRGNGRVRIRRYTTARAFRAQAPRIAAKPPPRVLPALRIRKYRGHPLRDMPLLASYPYLRRGEDDEAVLRRREKIRRKKEFAEKVGAWLGGLPGGEASLNEEGKEKKKRVFGAGMPSSERWGMKIE